MSAAMILTGAPGAGKSSVLDALCTMLEIERVEFAAIESEMFSRGWPWLSLAEWVPQLAAVVGLQRRAGRHTFLVVATVEDERELAAVINALDVEAVTVICLSVPPDLAAARIRAREPDSWPGKRGLVKHAAELAERIPVIPGVNAVLPASGRAATDIAAEIKELLVADGIIVR